MQESSVKFQTSKTKTACRQNNGKLSNEESSSNSRCRIRKNKTKSSIWQQWQTYTSFPSIEPGIYQFHDRVTGIAVSSCSFAIGSTVLPFHHVHLPFYTGLLPHIT